MQMWSSLFRGAETGGSNGELPEMRTAVVDSKRLSWQSTAAAKICATLPNNATKSTRSEGSLAGTNTVLPGPGLGVELKKRSLRFTDAESLANRMLTRPSSAVAVYPPVLGA